jgi:hypothetical protein
MRVSHYADIIIVLAFVIAYQFNAEPRLSDLPVNQLGTKIQEVGLDSAPAKKADRLAPNEEDQRQDQLFSPKLVRLEKYDLPTDDDLNKNVILWPPSQAMGLVSHTFRVTSDRPQRLSAKHRLSPDRAPVGAFLLGDLHAG